MSPEMLEQVARNDGYVISKHSAGYTVRLRGAVGTGSTLKAAIEAAIQQDRDQESDLGELDETE